jgi:hypothetical protein
LFGLLSSFTPLYATNQRWPQFRDGCLTPTRDIHRMTTNGSKYKGGSVINCSDHILTPKPLLTRVRFRASRV